MWTLTHLKINFFGRPYFGHYARGAAASNFLHVLDNDQGLLTHISHRDGGTPKIFNNKIRENWPHVERITSTVFGASGSNVRKLFHVTCLEAGIRIYVKSYMF